MYINIHVLQCYFLDVFSTSRTAPHSSTLVWMRRPKQLHLKWNSSRFLVLFHNDYLKSNFPCKMPSYANYSLLSHFCNAHAVWHFIHFQIRLHYLCEACSSTIITSNLTSQYYVNTDSWLIMKNKQRTDTILVTQSSQMLRKQPLADID